MNLSLTLTRILVYLSAAGASLAVWQRRQLKVVSSLSPGPDGESQFAALLEAHPGVPVSIAVDTVDEQFREEILPRVFGVDRREMTQRRLRQLLVQSPYRAVQRQATAQDGVDGSRYLFMGLTNIALLRPWLDQIDRHQAPLARIWLTAALSGQMLRRLGLAAGRRLLVSEQTGGLRLSYFEAGQLRFSRLAPVDNALYENPLEGYGDEIERTRQYLLSQRLQTRQDVRQIQLIDPLDSLGELHSMLPESAGFRCETVPRPRLVAELGLPPSLLAPSTDAIFLNLLPQAERQANLLPSEMRAAYGRFLARRWLYTGGAIWLALSVLLGLALTLEAWRVNRASEDYAQLVRTTRANEQRLVGSPEELHQLRRQLDILSAWRQVDLYDGDVGADLESVMATLRPWRGLRIQELTWQGPDGQGGGQIRLQGEFHPFAGDYQAVHGAIRDLVDELGRSGWRARVEQWPLDETPEGVARGELSNGTARMRAEFSRGLKRTGTP